MWHCAILAVVFLAPAVADEGADRRAKTLIQQLGDSSFEVREKATRQLQELGEAVRPLVERAAKEAEEAEVRTRAAVVLRELDAARNRAIKMHVVGVYQASGDHFQLVESWGRGIDWEGLCAQIVTDGEGDAPNPGKRIWEFLAADARSIVEDETLTKALNALWRKRGEDRPDAQHLKALRTLTAGLTDVLSRDDFYEEKAFAGIALPQEVQKLLKVKERSLLESRMLNRRLFELAFPRQVAQEAFTLESITVPVRVLATPEPITLVLCSYESVRWKITLDAGARVEKVLVGGYHISEAFGVDASITYYLYDSRERRKEEPRYFYAYQRDGPEYLKFEETLRQLTGKEISTFQGGHGSEPAGFVVPAKELPKAAPPAELNEKEAKAADEIAKIGGRLANIEQQRVSYTAEEVRRGLLWLSYCKESDKALELAQDLPPVRSVYLDFRPVSEAGMAHIGNFEELKFLSLRKSKVPTAALKHLARCKQLEHLVLTDTGADDETAEHLAKLPKLKHLGLHNTAITDQGLESLAKLAGLESLSLDNTKITAAGLERLRNLERLASIGLNGVAVGDEGVKTLAQMKGLVAINLNGCQITDAGLKQLASLEKLKVLYLAGNEISPSGYESLRDASKLSQLYLGIDLSSEELDAVQKTLPKVEVRYIRGQ
jgi:hypothetical protein